jgi:response regulator of citrate/malate metabolism
VIGVLIVDDERLTRELHAEYVARVEGFEVVGECAGARAAVTAVLDHGDRIDLVLLDMTMPDGSGLDVARYVRSRSADVDLMAITGVRDAENVRAAAALGIAQYLVKPFTFATFRERLEQYREYRQRSAATAGEATQAEIDALLGALRPAGTASLPKGLAPATLERVAAVARSAGAISASEAAASLGMSRVAARRYLEHLADEKRVDRGSRYGTPGRPETEYVWR